MVNCVHMIECYCHILNFNCGLITSAIQLYVAKFNGEASSGCFKFIGATAMLFNYVIDLHVSLPNGCLHSKF